MLNRIDHNLTDEYYHLLVKYYHEQWPNNLEYINKIYNFPDDIYKFSDDFKFYQKALNKFKCYINTHSHPKKCIKKRIILDIDYVSYSDEYIQLHKLINQYLNINEVIFYYTQIIDALKNFLDNLIQSIQQNPLHAILFCIGLAFLCAQISLINKKFNDRLDVRFENYIKNLQDKGVTFRNITEETKICHNKELGINEGKICKINNVTFFLKNLNSHNIFTGYNNPLTSIPHQSITNKMQIRTPEFQFFTEKNEKNSYYLASREIKNFQSTFSFTQKNFDAVITQNQNLAKLAVACSLIGDLHSENIGFNEKNELVIVDLDMRLNCYDEGTTMGDKFSYHLKQGLEYFKYLLILLKPTFPPLSIKDIQSMRKLYLQINQGPFSDAVFKLDLNEEIYHTLLQVYISACDELLLLAENPKFLNEYVSTVSYAESFINYLLIDQEVYALNLLFVEMCRKHGSYAINQFSKISEEVTDSNRQSFGL